MLNHQLTHDWVFYIEIYIIIISCTFILFWTISLALVYFIFIQVYTFIYYDLVDSNIVKLT